jgi:hypothetical protein
MVRRTGRTRPATVVDARARLGVARAYLDVAELVLDDRDRVEMPGVAAGLAVLAGIAASDAICARRVGAIHRGDDHRAAAELLRPATPDGNKLAATLQRLMDMKDEAHYGVTVVSAQRARSAARWARQLVARAQEVTEQ